MKLKTPKNINYCATIAKIDQIVQLNNCDNVVAAIVRGNQVIVQKDSKIGDIGVLFTIETRLSDKYCKENNLNSDPLMNSDQTKKGYISKGRIKCVRFRTHKSEGLFMPLESLSSFIKNPNDLKVGDEFDQIDEEIICEKYVPIIRQKGENNVKKYKDGVPKFNRLVENQFKFHIDTAQLKKNIHNINPEDIISISEKYHGTSAIAGKILTNKKLNWKEKFSKFLGIEVKDKIYGLIYSSRSVIKNKYIETNKDIIEKRKKGELVKDIWEITAEELEPFIPNGITLYYEIVGYNPSGGSIQKMGNKTFHYGCSIAEHKSFIYRITSVNDSGDFTEYSFGQIKDFCRRNGLNCVKEYYYGLAKNLYKDIPINDNWQKSVLDKMQTDFNLEKMCELCNKEVPAEGVVVRVDNLYDDKAYKLKSYLFLEKETKELDSGSIDMETAESSE